MKRGITIHLPVEIEFDLAKIDYIEFIFKQSRNEASKALKTSYWSSSEDSDVLVKDGIFYVPWEREETYKFIPNAMFYMDTRITLKEGLDNPETEIVGLKMNDTLFAHGEVVENG